jgi:general secretion pathway protein H
MTSRNNPPQQDAGFTLLEMLVVIAVMGLILAMVLNFGPPQSHGLTMRAATAETAAAMRMARARAIASDRPVTLTLPTLPNWINVSLESGPGGIVFDPDGSTSGGSVVLNAGARRTTITADWLTGQVSIDAP